MREHAGEQGLLLEQLALDALALAHLRLQEHVERAHALLGALQLRVAVLHPPHLGAQPQHPLHLAREAQQAPALLLAQLAGPRIDDAQGAQHPAVLGVDGRARVEARVGRPHDERVGGEALIGPRVLDHDEPLAPHGLCTEGEAALRLARTVQSHIRLEPLAVIVHQRDDCDGRVTHLRGEPDDLVVVRLG